MEVEGETAHSRGEPRRSGEHTIVLAATATIPAPLYFNGCTGVCGGSTWAYSLTQALLLPNPGAQRDARIIDGYSTADGNGFEQWSTAIRLEINCI